jgi:hypothetical protein
MADPFTEGFLQGCYDRLQRFCNSFSQKRFWKFYLAFLCCIYCICTNIPQYTSLIHGQARGLPIWHRINNQIDHPFTADTSNDPESHEALLTFRLTPSLIGKMLPVTDLRQRMTGLFVIQNICGFLFFYLLIVFAEANFNSRLFSFLLPWCFAVLYAGKTFFCDTIFFFDGMAYLFLLASICTRKPLLVLASLFLAFYTDERALIGSGFVMLYHVLQNQQGNRQKPAIIAIVSAIALYIATRAFLQIHFGLAMPPGAVHTLTTPLHTYFGFILLGIFTAFKSFWLVFILGLFFIKGFWAKSIYCVTLLSIIIGGISVFDFSRSISYGFVGLLAVLFCLYSVKERVAVLNKFVLLLLATSFLYPAYDVHRHEVFFTRSVFSKYLETKYTPLPGDRDAPSVLEQTTH